MRNNKTIELDDEALLSLNSIKDYFNTPKNDELSFDTNDLSVQKLPDEKPINDEVLPTKKRSTRRKKQLVNNTPENCIDLEDAKIENPVDVSKTNLEVKETKRVRPANLRPEQLVGVSLELFAARVLGNPYYDLLKTNTPEAIEAVRKAANAMIDSKESGYGFLYLTD